MKWAQTWLLKNLLWPMWPKKWCKQSFLRSRDREWQLPIISKISLEWCRAWNASRSLTFSIYNSHTLRNNSLHKILNHVGPFTLSCSICSIDILNGTHWNEECKNWIAWKMLLLYSLSWTQWYENKINLGGFVYYRCKNNRQLFNSGFGRKYLI